MRYGLPYKGSKNAIAKWVVSQLPKAEHFVDLFFGGGAITHRAMLSGKYRFFTVNDIDGRLPKLFVECAYGKHTIQTHPEWISREEFNRRKDNDAYIALIWSFGNNGKDYIYGEDIEPYKKALHYAVFYNDLAPLSECGIELVKSPSTDINKRFKDYSQQLLRCDTEQLQRLETFERFESLKSLQSLQSLQNDYQQVKTPPGAVIYCDPPYADTNCGKYDGFDSERFYEWAERQENIFISEYNMPDNFIPIAQTGKVVLSSAGGTNSTAVEKLYTNERTWNKLPEEEKRLYKLNFAEQITFF